MAGSNFGEFIFSTEWRDVCWEIGEKFSDHPSMVATRLIHEIDETGSRSFNRSTSVSLSAILYITVVFSDHIHGPAAGLPVTRRVSYIVLCQGNRIMNNLTYSVITWASIQHVKENPGPGCTLFLELEFPSDKEVPRIANPCCEKWADFLSTAPGLLSEFERRFQAQLRENRHRYELVIQPGSLTTTQRVSPPRGEIPSAAMLAAAQDGIRDEIWYLIGKNEKIKATHQASVRNSAHQKSNLERRIALYNKKMGKKLQKIEEMNHNFSREQERLIAENKEKIKNLEARLTSNAELLDYLNQHEQLREQLTRLDERIDETKRMMGDRPAWNRRRH